MAVLQAKSITLFVAVIGLIFFLATLPAKAQSPEGLIIRTIYINNQNVFNLDDKRESGFFYKSANFLHIKTNNTIIKQQLLFKEGDVYSREEIEESERLLRTNKYIRDAHISAIQQDGEVEIHVMTSDTWSTKPTLSFGRVGGKNKSELGLEEENLFGRGINLGISYRKDIDRTSTNFRIADKHFLKSRYRVEFQHSDFSDGNFNLFAVEKPFYSMDSHYSHGLAYHEENITESLYFEGDSYFSWDQQVKEADIFWGWSKGLQGQNVMRHNLGYHTYENYSQDSLIQPEVENPLILNYLNNFNMPDQRIEHYPYYSFEFSQNRYDKTQNQDKIARVEDRYLGTEIGMQVGFINTAFGSDENFVRVEGYASKNKRLSDKVFTTSGLSLDFEYSSDNANFSNALLNYYSRIYVSQTENWRFYADFTGIEGYKLRNNRQVFLDDNAGFRGYPLRYLSGDSAQKLTFEQRYFFHSDLWRIFNFGAALFFDVGNISGGTSFEREQNGIYKTIGLGLRVGSNRSSRGDIVHIDLSAPLDAPDDLSQVQLTVVTKATF